MKPTTNNKKQKIIDIVNEGLEVVQTLPEEDLRAKIIGHFMSIQNLVGANIDFEKLEPVAKQLTVGVIEAATFGDVEILNEVELIVRETIDSLG